MVYRKMLRAQCNVISPPENLLNSTRRMEQSYVWRRKAALMFPLTLSFSRRWDHWKRKLEQLYEQREHSENTAVLCRGNRDPRIHCGHHAAALDGDLALMARTWRDAARSRADVSYPAGVLHVRYAR